MAQDIPIEELEKSVQALTWQRGLLAGGVLLGAIAVGTLAGRLIRWAYAKEVRGPAFAFSKLLTYVVVFAGAVAALAVLGLPLSSLLLTSGALLVGIGFSLQHVTRDFVSGIIILVEQSVRKNDYVSFSGTSGTVREIGLRATQLLTPDGTVLVVPNHLLVSTEVANQSHPLKRSRLRVEVPVANSESVDEAAEAIVSAAQDHPEVLFDPAPLVWLEAIETWGYRFLLIAWIGEPVADRRVSSQLRFAVCRELTARGIRFPPTPVVVSPDVPDAPRDPRQSSV